MAVILAIGNLEEDLRHFGTYCACPKSAVFVFYVQNQTVSSYMYSGTLKEGDHFADLK